MEGAGSRKHRRPKHAIPPAGECARGIDRVLPLAAVMVALSCAGAARAIGLDEIAQQSVLGEPLRLVIPVLSTAGDLASEEFAGECFKLVAPAAGDLPQLSSARISLEHRAGRAFVVVTTSYPVNEPIMRVAVQAGCGASMSREYTVLLDPVAIEPPIAEKVVEMPVAAARPPSVAVAAPEARIVPPATVSRRNPASVAKSAPEHTGHRIAPPGTPAGAAPVRAAKAAPQPRLQVSRTVVDSPPGGVRGAAQGAAAEREALRTIEEQTVVLQRQIAELSIAMERMQQELTAARAAKAEAERTARTADERPGSTANGSWAVLRVWAGANWPLLVLIPAVIVLLAAALHRRRPILVPAPITPAQAAAFNRADLGEPVPGPESLEDIEAVVDPLPTTSRARFISSALVDSPPSAPDSLIPEPDFVFDDEVQRMAEVSSGYSALEREQPGIVGRLTDTWGTPQVAAQLEGYLLTPRRGGRTLSHGVIDELTLLRSIALDHGGGVEAAMMAQRPRGGNGQLRPSGRRL